MAEILTPEAPPQKPTDADVMVGGPPVPPALKEPEKPAEPPAATKLKLGSKEYEVAPDVAEAIESYRRELNERDGRRGSEVERLRREMEDLRKSVTPPVEPKKPDAPQPPNPLLVLENPEQYQREMLAYVNGVNALRDQALREEYQKAERARQEDAGRKENWDRQVSKFYQTHQDLVGEEDLVDLVWKQHFEEIRSLPVTEGFEKVADLARERILRYASRGKDKDAPAAPKLEGSRTRQSAPVAPAKDEPTGSLSASIRAKQRRMRGISEPAAK